MDKTPVFGLAYQVFFVILFVIKLELEVYQVNWSLSLPCLILFDASQERLGLKESTHPETLRGALAFPFFEEFDSFGQVNDPGCQRFDR